MSNPGFPDHYKEAPRIPSVRDLPVWAHRAACIVALKEVEAYLESRTSVTGEEIYVLKVVRAALAGTR